MAELSQLYQEVLIEHNRNPRGKDATANATHHAQGHNPLCGDHLEIYLTIHDDIVVAGGFSGESCAISTASASMLIEALEGKPLTDAKALIERFTNALSVSTSAEIDEEIDDSLKPLLGVSAFPARIKCALLPWRTAEAAMNQPESGNSDPVTTE